MRKRHQERPYGHKEGGDGEHARVVGPRTQVGDGQDQNPCSEVVGTGYHPHRGARQVEPALQGRGVHVVHPIYGKPWHSKVLNVKHGVQNKQKKGHGKPRHSPLSNDQSITYRTSSSCHMFFWLYDLSTKLSTGGSLF